MGAVIHAVDAMAASIRHSGIGAPMTDSLWLWPLCETLHFIGLALVIGIVGFFDLRLIGFFRQIPVSAARELMPFALFGFGLNLVTGVLFFVGHPEQYVHDMAWWLKVGSLALAGLNAAVFEAAVGARTVTVGAGEETPAAAKAIGVVSIVAWFGVLFWGRMLPFIGNAF